MTLSTLQSYVSQPKEFRAPLPFKQLTNWVLGNYPMVSAVLASRPERVSVLFNRLLQELNTENFDAVLRDLRCEIKEPHAFGTDKSLLERDVGKAFKTTHEALALVGRSTGHLPVGFVDGLRAITLSAHLQKAGSTAGTQPFLFLRQPLLEQFDHYRLVKPYATAKEWPLEFTILNRDVKLKLEESHMDLMASAMVRLDTTYDWLWKIEREVDKVVNTPQPTADKISQERMVQILDSIKRVDDQLPDLNAWYRAYNDFLVGGPFPLQQYLSTATRLEFYTELLQTFLMDILIFTLLERMVVEDAEKEKVQLRVGGIVNGDLVTLALSADDFRAVKPTQILYSTHPCLQRGDLIGTTCLIPDPHSGKPIVGLIVDQGKAFENDAYSWFRVAVVNRPWEELGGFYEVNPEPIAATRADPNPRPVFCGAPQVTEVGIRDTSSAPNGLAPLDKNQTLEQESDRSHPRVRLYGGFATLQARAGILEAGADMEYVVGITQPYEGIQEGDYIMLSVVDHPEIVQFIVQVKGVKDKQAVVTLAYVNGYNFPYSQPDMMTSGVNRVHHLLHFAFGK